MKRNESADLILLRIAHKEHLREEFGRHGIRSFLVDDLLEASLAREIHECFPRKEQMLLRDMMRERKCVAARMSRYVYEKGRP